MGLLEGLVSGAINGAVAMGIRSARNDAAQRKLEAQTKDAAEKAGMSVYAYVKTQLRGAVRKSIEETNGDLDKLERYLQACVDQKLMSAYYRTVIWEEEKGQCALRRLQATGGAPWKPHDILRGLAPEKVLNQCDKDADSYGLQIVYLDQQVVQENVTRETADLILNIYNLARDERG